VVWLDAAPDVLARRVARAEGRPLLADADGGLEQRLRALLAERAPAYAGCDLRVPAADSPERVCDAVLAALGWECAA
jgi:shikimate kinase